MPVITSRRQRLAFTRNSALAVRELVDPGDLAMFDLYILMGKDPVFVEVFDEHGEHIGFRVEALKEGFAPTLDQKSKAKESLWNRGYGGIVETLKLDANVESRHTSQIEAVNVGVLSASKIHRMLEIVREPRELASARDESDAIDAEFTEASDEQGSPSDTSDDDTSDDGDDTSDDEG